MSTTIDNKVVEMRFDNKQFEKNVQTSIHTLDKLDKSLRLEDASKGFESVEKAAKKVDLNPLASAVKTVRIEFSAMQVVAISALKNITDSAMRSAKKIASALTIDPVKTGLHEYETQINATQTILSNTQKEGATINDVNAALDELNKYADLTIYNFTEMTKNIGTFTAAGVDLKTSVSAIQGIANLAAVSGSTSQQASTAMYQLSQALASGTVKLMDWNSVVNAGMGGQVFQDALKDTARQHGIAIDKMIKKQGSFRETLKNGWLTSEILTETLSKFTTSGVNEYLAKNSDLTIKSIETMRREAVATGDSSKAFKEMAKTIAATSKISEDEIYNLLKMSQTAEEAATKVKTFSQLWDVLKETAQSGWSASWRTIVGDYEEAKETLTEFSDTLTAIISESADKRNKKLVEGLSSGWKQFLNEGITNSLDFQDTVIATAKEYGISIDDIIDRTGSFEKSLKEGWINSEILTVSVSKLADKTSNLSDKELENLGYTRDQAEALEELNTKIQNGSLNLDEFVEKMSKPSGRENLIDAIRNTFDYIMSIVKPIKEAFEEVFGTTGKQIYNFTQRIKDFTSRLHISEETAAKLKNIFKGIGSGIEILYQVAAKVFDTAKPIFEFIGIKSKSLLDFLSKIGERLISINDDIKKTGSFGKILDGIFSTLKNLLKGIPAFVSSIGDAVGKLFENIFEKVKTIGSAIWQNVKQVFSNIVDNLKSGNSFDVESLLKSGFLVSLVIGIKKLIKSITEIFDPSKNDFLSKIKGVLDAVSGAFDTVRKSLETWQMTIKADAIFKIAVSIGILAGALLLISSIDKEKIADGLGAITTLFVDLVASMNLLGTTKGKISSVLIMLSMATSILILAVALKKISSLNSDELTRGIMGIAGIAMIIGFTVNYLSVNQKKILNGASGLIFFAFAIKILAGVCIQLSSLSWEELEKGLLGVGVLIGEVGAFLSLTEFKRKTISTAIGMVILASAIKILETSVKAFATMQWEEIEKGLTAIGGLLLELSLFANFTGKAKHVIKTALSMTIIAYAIKQLVVPLQEIAQLSWGQLVKSLVGMFGLLTAITLSLRALPKANLLKIAIVFPTLAGAISSLSKSLISLGALSLGQLAIGLGGIAGTLIILVLALKQCKGLDKAASSLTKAALALTILAIPMTMFAKLGIIGAATSLVVLAGSLTILAIAAKKIGKMHSFFAKASKSIALFSLSLITLGAAMAVVGVGMSTFVTSFVSAIIMLQILKWDQIGKGILFLVGALTFIGITAKILSPFTKQILSLAGAMALFSLSCLGIAASMLLLSVALSSLSVVGATGAKTLMEAIDAIVMGLLETIKKSIPELITILKELAINTLKSLEEVIPQLASTLLKTILTVLDYLVDYGPQIIAKLFDFLILIIDGLTAKVPELLTSIFALVRTIFEEIGKALETVGTEKLKDVIRSFAMVSGLMYVLSKVGKLTGKALIGVLGVGAVIAAMTVVLAGIGKLEELLGAKDLIDKGGDALESISRAIGRFIGGFVSGIAEGLVSSLPNIATKLSDFMVNIAPFIDGANKIKPETITGVKGLVDIIGQLAGFNLLTSLTFPFTGGNFFSGFKEQLNSFGDAITSFSTKVAGNIDIDAIKQAVKAGEALIEMANTVPNRAGLEALFVGENSLVGFSEEIVEFGKAIVKFSSAVKGKVDISSVKSAAKAGEALTEMADTVPNRDGLVALFTGENSLISFSEEIVEFGKAIVKFSSAVKGKVDISSVTSAAKAGKALTEMADTVPNRDGLVALFTGENSLISFSEEIVEFGKAITKFSSAVKGKIDIASIKSATKAGEALTEMANVVPNRNGIAAWITGENSLIDFSEEIIAFGKAITKFSSAVKGKIDISSVTSAAKAGEALAEMANIVPNRDGVGAWITGENSLIDFSEEIIEFGKAISTFSTKVKGKIDISSVTSAAKAGEALAEMANIVPNRDGVGAWITGENSLIDFSEEIIEFGKAISTFSTKVKGKIDISSIKSAAKAGEAIAKMASVVPNRDGIAAWITGENSLIGFSEEIPEFGKAIVKFSNSVSGGIDTQNIIRAVGAGKSLAEMTNLVPKQGGLKAWFSGSDGFMAFSSNIEDFGKTIKFFSDRVSTGIDTEAIMTAINIGNEFAAMTEKFADVESKTSTSFNLALRSFAENGIDGFVSAFTDSKERISTVGANLTKSLIEGITSDNNAYSEKANELIKSFAEAIKNNSQQVVLAIQFVVNNMLLTIYGKRNDFYNVGGFFIQGICDGINGNLYLIIAKAREIAKSIDGTLKKELQIHSPSKKGEETGEYYGDGVIIGLENRKEAVGQAASEYADQIENHYWKRMLELKKEAEAVKADETTSIFSELSSESDSKAKKKNKDLTKILQARMNLTEKYLKVREKLENRLKGSKLWNYVSTLGEDSLSDLETLNSMTEEKLKEYADLYEKYFALGIEKAKTVLSESDLKTYQEKVLEDTKSTIKTYQDEIKKLTDNFVQKTSIFEPFEQKEGIASQTLMNNLDARITYFEEYSRIRNSLQNKLENNETSLWEDVVKDLGMDDIATLKALDNMSIQDLNTYSWKYQKLLLEGKNLAVRDAKKTKEETEKTLSELYGTPIDLDEFLSVYDGTFESIDYYVVMKAKQSGSNFVTDFSAGITENTSKATDSAKEMTDKTVAKADDISKEKSPAVGANLVQGFANGITDNSYIAEAAASAVATNAINAANNTLGIASPSKVMYGSGRYTIMGFVSGLLDFAQDVYSAGSEVGKQAKDGLLSSMSNIASLVDGSMEYRPTIRPILDLSNVETGSRQLSSLFSSDQAMKISASMKREDEMKNQNGSEKQPSSTVYQFTQNNYSPKALSRLDIYRQTKNQFSTLKGLV